MSHFTKRANYFEPDLLVPGCGVSDPFPNYRQPRNLQRRETFSSSASLQSRLLSVLASKRQQRHRNVEDEEEEEQQQQQARIIRGQPSTPHSWPWQESKDFLRLQNVFVQTFFGVD
jgi:hypothetical protein